jgi:thiol:disulfide interchange protein DsbD
MPIFKIIFLCFLSLANLPVFALGNDELLPPEQAFRISGRATAADRLEVSWDIAEGYYLYRDKLRFESRTEAIQTAPPVLPDGEIKHDEFFGEMVIYRHALTIPVPLTVSNGTSSLQLRVRYQGCADQGICYPPQTTVLDITLPAAAPAVQANPIQQLVKSNRGITLNLSEDDLLPPDQAFQFLASVKDARTLRADWRIADGYYLYREKIQLELVDAAGAQLGAYDIPRGTPKYDEAFGQVETFYNELGFDLPLIRSNPAVQAITLRAKYQGCADRGVCYPPMTQEISLDLPASPQDAALVKSIPSAGNAAASPELSEQDRIVQSLRQDTLWMTLLSFFGFGLLLSFTPCVFPMIPILSGIIVGHGNRITTARAFLLSLSYVVASAVTYTIFGILAALFGSNLQTTFQQPWIIALFSAVFILLSLSMFDFYHLEMPKSLQAKLHNSSEKHRDGSLWGAAIMGSLSSLIVGPCVAAPLAGALIYIGQTGDAVLGGSALFTMGLGMGVPLLLLGASAGKLLPKAGGWLNSTKAVFGVIMLAVAVWMLDRILPAPVTMLLWAMLLIIPAIYLSAIDPLPAQASGWRKLWKGVGLIMLSYGVLVLIGFSIGNTNPLKPLNGLGMGSLQAATTPGIAFERVASVTELDARIRQAQANNQPVMLDFYADWCTSCKEMEAYTFTDSRVKQALANFVVLQADVTQNSKDDKALLARFNLIGPPGVLFFDTDGQEQAALRVIGYQDADTFLKTLTRIQS